MGGHGGVTAFRMLAAAALLDGKHSLSIPYLRGDMIDKKLEKTSIFQFIKYMKETVIAIRIVFLCERGVAWELLGRLFKQLDTIVVIGFIGQHKNIIFHYKKSLCVHRVEDV